MARVHSHSGFYGQLRGYDGRDAKYRRHVPLLVVIAQDSPREALLSLGVAGHVEHFNITHLHILILFCDETGPKPHCFDAVHRFNHTP